ncbi:MAG: hAT transposon family protein, partial [Pseudoalteromonas sp.]|nr:hAT transposon family protein [Pseudoalteromonas sp.]
KLFHLAVQMLAIPATPAPDERMFSQAGLSASGQRNSIGPALIEAEVIMKYNKSLK